MGVARKKTRELRGERSEEQVMKERQRGNGAAGLFGVLSCGR